MSYWVKKLRKSGFDIDEVGFLNIYRSNHDWQFINKGEDGKILRSNDKILKIQMDIEENNKFNKRRVNEFMKEIKMQKMVYTCTKGYRALTPKIFAYGKNWILMKNVPGRTISDWYKSNREDVFQKAMRAYIKALQKIHRTCGIGHFDAHGGNAMYDDKTNTIKIIDWGWAAMISKNNLTKEGILKRYKEVYSNKIASGKTRNDINWITKLKRNPVGQYAIEIVPYNARFKDLKPKENIVDFIQVILNSSNNFPTYVPMTRARSLKTLITARSPSPPTYSGYFWSPNSTK